MCGKIKRPSGLCFPYPTISNLFSLTKLLRDYGKIYVVTSLQSDWTWEDDFTNFIDYYKAAMEMLCIEPIDLPDNIEYKIVSRGNGVDGSDYYILSDLNDGILWLLSFAVCGGKEVFILPKQPNREVFMCLIDNRLINYSKLPRETEYRFLIRCWGWVQDWCNYVIVAGIGSREWDSTAVILTRDIELVDLIKDNIDFNGVLGLDIDIYRFPGEAKEKFG